MKIHVHLGPAAKPSSSEPALQILLTRCQATPRSGWVSTSFHKAIKQFDGKEADGHFKSLKKGALPGLVAWLLRKQAGAAEPLSRQVSDQLGELIVQSDAKRKQTWLWAFLGGDPRHFFRQVAGVWQPGEALQKAEVLAMDHGTIPKAGNLDQNGTKWTDPAELTEVTASLLPPVLSIEMQFKRVTSGLKAWKRFDTHRDKLTPEHELKITVACPDGKPRNIAVAGLTSAGEAVGFWPWLPTAPGGWNSQAEIGRIIAQHRNPKTEVGLPGLWNEDGHKSLIISEGGAVHCLVVMLYHLEDPTNAKTHAATLQKLVNSIKAIRLDTLLSPSFAKTKSFVVAPVAAGGIWRQLEKLPGEVKKRLATGNRDIEFAEAVVLPTEVP